jgi:hypothetical protein
MPQVLERVLKRMEVTPTITAHPTEAKRTTVLEAYRRIYRTLVELESSRWTPRERDRLTLKIRNQIELSVADRRIAPAPADAGRGGDVGLALLQRDAVFMRGGSVAQPAGCVDRGTIRKTASKHQPCCASRRGLVVTGTAIPT